MPKIVSPSDKKIFGLSLYTRQIEKMHIDGYESTPEWVDYLLITITKLRDKIDIMQLELDKIPATPNDVKTILEALPPSPSAPPSTPD